MSAERFKIIFERLEELAPPQRKEDEAAFVELGVSKKEFDAIDELRRAVLEITDPEPKLYTTS